MNYFSPAPPLDLDNKEVWRANRKNIETSHDASTVLGVMPNQRGLVHRLITPLINFFEYHPDMTRACSLRLALSLTKLELTYPNLPPDLDGYRLLHITDPHLDGSPASFQRLMKAVDGASVDMIVMTGDYVLNHFDRKAGAKVVAQLRELVDRLNPRDGVFTILGNHDYTDMYDQFLAADIPCLVNESISIKRGDARLFVTGTDDVYHFYSDGAPAALARAGQKHPQEFRLAAIHSAELADVAAANDYDLYLCGHTHGGQVCLKKGQPIMVLLRTHKELCSGLWQIGSMQGYTSRGIGASDLPVRFNCPAEVTQITLRKYAPSL